MEVWCSLAAVDAGEELAGSAPERTSLFLLLEVPGAWAPKPIGSPDLPEPVRARLKAWEEAFPESRLQLIRRGGGDGAPAFFVASTAPGRRALFEVPISGYEELCDLDLAAVARGEHPGARRREERMFLVCTHGKRDRCCAKWGIPVFLRMAEHAEGAVWQTTHTGGHRFAPNVVVLPDGIVYGRVTADEAPALIDAHRQGELHDPARLRGRTAWDPPEQAAEVFLRRELGLRGLDDLRLAGTTAQDGGRTEVRFVDATGAERRVTVAEEERPTARPTSCGDAPKPVVCFRRVG